MKTLDLCSELTGYGKTLLCARTRGEGAHAARNSNELGEAVGGYSRDFGRCAWRGRWQRARSGSSRSSRRSRLLALRTHPKMSLVPRELMPLLSARSWSLRAHHREAFHMSQCEAQAHPERHARWCVGMGSPVNLLLKLLHGRHGGCRSMQKARRKRPDVPSGRFVCLSLSRQLCNFCNFATCTKMQLCTSNETSCQSLHCPYNILSSRTR